MHTALRSLALIALLFSAACSSPELAADQPTASPSETPTSDRPAANVTGSQIRLVKQHPAEADPVPEVRPRRPLHLVVDGCEDLQLFDVPSTDYSSHDQILKLWWSDPGTGRRNRSLTILLDGPGCSNHEGVKTLINP